MPRVSINRKRYMANDFSEWIIGRMHSLNMKQKDLGQSLGISQQAVCQMLKSGRFEYQQIITIIKVLHATDEEILRFMKL